ncbi:unnamed protein product [Protopolystoma xenopodis]|uniref:Secreted protein n=1 Tax=Protopolystoma xenopodis TaxID=117903 RepID=A0A448WXR8_9PLAT|nr:unnamed protein product [Protopolystoma xenopodis]
MPASLVAASICLAHFVLPSLSIPHRRTVARFRRVHTFVSLSLSLSDCGIGRSELDSVAVTSLGHTLTPHRQGEGYQSEGESHVSACRAIQSHTRAVLRARGAKRFRGFQMTADVLTNWPSNQ